jgi:hypothetical protein
MLTFLLVSATVTLHDSGMYSIAWNLLPHASCCTLALAMLNYSIAELRRYLKKQPDRATGATEHAPIALLQERAAACSVQFGLTQGI